MCFFLKVFLDAIQSPSPAFRYFTSTTGPPVTQLKVTEPDESYISAMSNIIFSTEEQ